MSDRYVVTDRKNRPVSAVVAIVVAILTAGYMLPVGDRRGPRHRNSWTVFWVNLLLGWTVIGWIVALVMAIREHRDRRHPLTGCTSGRSVLLRGLCRAGASDDVRTDQGVRLPSPAGRAGGSGRPRHGFTMWVIFDVVFVASLMTRTDPGLDGWRLAVVAGHRDVRPPVPCDAIWTYLLSRPTSRLVRGRGASASCGGPVVSCWSP